MVNEAKCNAFILRKDPSDDLSNSLNEVHLGFPATDLEFQATILRHWRTIIYAIFVRVEKSGGYRHL